MVVSSVTLSPAMARGAEDEKEEPADEGDAEEARRGGRYPTAAVAAKAPMGRAR